MIANINYKGVLADGEVDKVTFPSQWSPLSQSVVRCSIGSMIIFKSGKFRLMGVKEPINSFDQLPLKVESIQVQSISLIAQYGRPVRLGFLHSRLTSRRCMFEPELFPAARLLDFNPVCVNVFSTGKVVMLGVRDFNSCSILTTRVMNLLNDTLTY
jgi:TATA-box binding protein (TBP) (component of TFIID and TFIIIB)